MKVSFNQKKENDSKHQGSEEPEYLAIYDPLSEFNILSFITWDNETLSFLANEWKLRGIEGLCIAEFVHVMLKVFPPLDKRYPGQKRQWVQKLYVFFSQIDYNHSKKVKWEDFLSFITACCVFDREKTRVDTVVQYHFEKEINDKSGNFTLLKFLYDSTNDVLYGFNTNGSVQLYSPSSLTVLRKVQLHGRPISCVYDGTLVHERSLLAVVYPTGIQIISTMQGSSLAQDIETTDTTHFCIVYEPTTRSLLTGSESGRLHCWRAQNWGEKPSRMNWHCVSSVKVTRGTALTCICLLSNTTSFVTGDEDGQLIVWDRKNIRLIHRIQAHHAAIHTIVQSDSLHAVITAAYESTVCVWNPFIPFLISKIDCPTGIVTAMTCLPDSPHMIMADRNGNLHVVNSRIMSIVQTFSISPFGQFATRVNLTQTTYKQLSRSLLTTGAFPITSLSHCGPRKRFVLGGRMIRFYEYEENIQPILSDRVPIRSAIMNHQFHVVATCSGCNIRHWEAANGLMRCVFRKATSSNITCMCVDSAETIMFIGCQEGEVLALHFPTGQKLHEIGQNQSSITSVSFCKKLQLILTSGWGGLLTIWRNSNDGKIAEFLTEKKDDLLCMAISDDHFLIATGNGKGEIHIWNLMELTLVCVLIPQNSETEILSLLFVEDSSLLVSSDSDGCITFWNVVTDEPSAVTQLPNFYIESSTSNILAMCVRDQFLVTADHCGEIRLWDISQLISQYPSMKSQIRPGSEIQEFYSTLNQKGKTIRYFTSQVKQVLPKHFSMPVGSFQLIIKWKAHHSAITSVSSFMANNNAVVLTSSNDCSVAVWDMKTGECYGFLQSNPSFGLQDRRWNLKYNPIHDPVISVDHILRIIDEAESVKTPPSSSRVIDM